jgi:3-methyladenine DNA glycosylase AlkD
LKIRAEIESLDAGLRAAGSSERAHGAKQYLKSSFDFLGVTTPELRRQVGAWLGEHPNLTRDELVRFARALFRRRIHELKAAAIVLLESRQELLEPEDLALLEEMLRRSYTWAYVDALAIHVVGPLVERHSGLAARLDRWAKDPDFWIRRSALLALLLPLRRGGGDWQRITRYADAMLEEREFFIRKAIGWVLRERGKVDPEAVASFVAKRIGRVSGVTLREAVKYLGAGRRQALLAAYSSGQG